MPKYEMEFVAQKKIPSLIPIDGYKNVPIMECNESLVQLYESERLKLSMLYFKKNFEGAEDVSYVRASVSKMLSHVSIILPREYILTINDGWRSYKVQIEIYKRMFEYIKLMHLDWSEEQLHEEASKFASSGSLDLKAPSPHFTGGSVDVTLANNKGIEYYMGSEFDEAIIESETRYFEEKIEKGLKLTNLETEALQNRRILFHCMIQAGFTNYSNEWWHFDYGNQLWAKIKDRNAFYGLTKP